MQHHEPNHIPLAHRFFYALASLTWVAWAMIGLFSGHMFLMISKKGPIQFSGVPAFIFCVAVLLSAVGMSVAIFDHYDKRNNEKTYAAIKCGFFWCAAIVFVAAIVVGLLERAGQLPWSDGNLGLLSVQQLHHPPGIQAVSKLLLPYKEVFSKVGWISFACLLIIGLLMKFLKAEENNTQSDWGWLIMPILMLATGSFVLYLLATHASWVENTLPGLKMSAPTARHKLAWVYSMLISSLGVAILTASAICLGLASKFGLLSDKDKLGKKPFPDY
jgi:hypothetical protein